MRIGGDIAGLFTLERTLVGVAPDIEEITRFLCGEVDALVHDAGWSGDAAAAFGGAWEQDAAALDELSRTIEIAGRTVGTLACELQAAQNRLDEAVDTARRGGVGFTDTGPLYGPYAGQAAQAAKEFAVEEKAALDAADAARQKAATALHALLSAINPAVPPDGTALGLADLAGLGGVLKGYYVIPEGRADDLAKNVADARVKYSAERAKWKNSEPGSEARRTLAAELRKQRAERTALASRLERAEALADRFKGGRLLDGSTADVFRGLGGELEADSKLSRVLDGVPGVDVALTGLATWAQMKDDHEKGWSWTHALLADGGANAAALAAGVAGDLIPAVGPFVSPVISYGVGAFVTEATHTGHWTEHIHDDGVVAGFAEGIADSGAAVWDNDVVGMGKKIAYDAGHPVEAAKSLWHEVSRLF